MSWSLEVAARTIAQEARGEPPDGQDAVAHVIKNRLIDGRWGHSLASVCLWPLQFSGWRGPKDPNFAYACNLDDNDPTLRRMLNVMQAAMDSHDDPTKGALFYYATSLKDPPSWSKPMTFKGQFGRQKFFTDRLEKLTS